MRDMGDVVKGTLPTSPHSPSSSRSSSIDSNSSPTSVSPSLEPTIPPYPTKYKGQAQHLFLRLQPVPGASAGTHTSKSQRFEEPLSPLSPSFRVDMDNTFPPASTRQSEADLRRKRVAKLTRTFGEPVPPELVLGAAPSSTPTASTRANKLRSRSGSQKSISALNARLRRSTSVNHLISAVPSAPLPALPPILKKRSSSTHSASGVHVHVTTTADRSSTIKLPRTSDDSTRDLLEWGKRKEREWSGEWNMRDMGDVVKGLRNLKGR